MNSNVDKDTMEVRRNLQRVYKGQSMGMVLFLLLTDSAFGVLFVKHMGGSDVQAMTLGALIMLPCFLQIPTSLLVPPSRGKTVMLWCWAGNAAFLLLALASTALLAVHPWRVNVFLLLVLCGATINMVGNTFWFPLLHDVVPEGRRGRFFGTLRAFFSAASFLVIVVSGVFLGDTPPDWKFQAVMGFGIGLLFLRNVYIARIPMRPASELNRDFKDWKLYVRRLLRRPEVMFFCLYFSLLGFFAAMLGKPLVLYMQYRGLATGESILIFGGSTLGQAALLFVGGHLVDRLGTRRVFLVAHLVLFAVALLVVGIGWVPSPVFKLTMPGLFMVCGGMMAVAGVACTVELFHLAPDRGRAFFMSLGMILLLVGVSISPILAGYAIESVPDGWLLHLGSVHFDIYQSIMLVSGTGLLFSMTLLRFVEDVKGGEH